MIITRTTARIVRPLWSSASAGYSDLYTPSWSANNDLNHPKRRFFDLCRIDPLQRYVGHWYETNSRNFDFLLKEAGLEDGLIAEATHRQAWTSFARDDEKWTLEYGTLKEDGYRGFHFFLNRPFYNMFINGLPSICLFTRKFGRLLERSESVEPSFKVMKTTRTLKDDNTMIVKLKVNHVVCRKTFKRILSEDEMREIIGFCP